MLRSAAVQRRTLLTFFSFLFVCTVLLVIAACGLVGIAMRRFDRELTDYQQLAHYQPAI